jgi:hypothetical protein
MVLGANCVELKCLGLGGKFCGTGLYSFGGGKICVTGIYSFGVKILWNWTT